ncbi:MAG: ferredoxin [Nitrospiraceae bacterium]|nr:ferredoxin [Nitrospiraceae bacterium]
MIPYIDYSRCEGCEACAALYPLFFEMRDGRAWVIHSEMFVAGEHKDVVFSCPFRAITVE